MTRIGSLGASQLRALNRIQQLGLAISKNTQRLATLEANQRGQRRPRRTGFGDTAAPICFGFPASNFRFSVWLQLCHARVYYDVQRLKFANPIRLVKPE